MTAFFSKRWKSLGILCLFGFGSLTPQILIGTANASEDGKPSYSNDPAYLQAIDQTFNMVQNPEARKLVEAHQLQIMNVTWEDTGRYKNSAVGPNISDMTIQVAAEDPASKQLKVKAMPVIRYPNFSDKTADLDPRDFFLLVGNQKGKGLKPISLHEFLKDPTQYLHDPTSWKHGKKTLLAKRDSKVLVSAQASFLPVPKEGKATFNPVVFNYQSYEKNPAVLTILATREGTSVTVIDNKRDAFEVGSLWGQRLFHNENGQRASLTGQRESDFQKTAQTDSNANPVRVNKVLPKEESGLNMVLLIQVPLKHKALARLQGDFAFGGNAPASPVMEAESGSNVENAVIGHGALEGPFTEIDGLKIERDERFPVRVTVQFYKATSNGIVSAADLKSIKTQIDRVYAQSDYVGSLVTEGNTDRITEYQGNKIKPKCWWKAFWKRHEQNTGETQEQAMQKWLELTGGNGTSPKNIKVTN